MIVRAALKMSPQPSRMQRSPPPAEAGPAAQLGALIQQRGLKRSRQRDLIAEVFFAAGGHPTVEALAQRVRARDARIGVATVYRTMKLLAELGLAHPRQFGDGGQTRYEPASPARHHDHLICTRCGAIVEFENDRIEELQSRIASSHGFRLGSHRLELYGECERCLHAPATAREVLR